MHPSLFLAGVLGLAAPALACYQPRDGAVARRWTGPLPALRTRDPANATATLRILHPYPNVYAYYDGRTGGRYHSPQSNGLDEGAFTLGVTTYAVVDSHITPAHAGAMAAHLRGLGVTKTTVVLSHYHNDHIAGSEAFFPAGSAQAGKGAGNVLVGHQLTAQTIQRRTAALAKADPPIRAVVPTLLYTNTTQITIGSTAVELHNFHIHTPDGTLLCLPAQNLLFAGDTVEDTATFIADASALPLHQSELARMAAQFPAATILPAHGSPDRIARGGYNGSQFIGATMRYLATMTEKPGTGKGGEPAAWGKKLKDVVAADVAAGALEYWPPYENVHQDNVDSIRETRGGKR